MRFALIPLQIDPQHPANNIARMADNVAVAMQRQPDLICLPECTLTGYVYEDEDVRRAAGPVPGQTTAYAAQLAKTHNVHICLGMVEAAGDRFYNVAVVLNPAGEIAAIHRKVQEMPPFATGGSLTTVMLDQTRLGLILCGDLFNANIITQLQTAQPAPGVVLVPMARCFDGPSPDTARWQREERQLYQDAVREFGIPTLIVNGLYDDYFGGAMVISGAGELLCESPHRTDQHLFWDSDV